MNLQKIRTTTIFPGYAAALVLAVCLLPGCSQQQAQPNDGMTEAQSKAGEARARLSASEGGQLVLRAIEAHGGLEAWYSAPTSSYVWEYSNAGSNRRFKTFLVADNATRRIYHEIQTLGTPEKTEPFEGSFAWDGENAWISPPDVEGINPRFWAATGFYFEQMPFVLADPGISYEVLPDEELDGVPHDMVKCSFGPGVGDSPGDNYTLYVNKDTGMVGALRYTVTYNRRERPDGPRETLFYYEDYVEVDGLKVATHFDGYWFEDGKKSEFKNEAWASDISFRRPFNEAQLQMPPDARIEPPPGQAQGD